MKLLLPFFLVLFSPFFLAHAGQKDNVLGDNARGALEVIAAGEGSLLNLGNVESSDLISFPEPSAWVLFGVGLGVLVILNVFSLKQRTRDFLEREEKLRKNRQN